jgi:hypothetical protein
MRSFFIFILAVSLSACALFPPIAAVEGASAVGSGKTFSDHLVSYASGMNCSTIRSNTGRTYCEENEPNSAPKVWCYRTIGKAVCYDRPDPYQGNQRKIGDNDHNLGTSQ